MELRVLRYFLTVAKEETISGAANMLHISQPTLSRQLMELEEELGAKLFIRGNRKIILTEEGLLLKKRAEEISELVNKTEAEFLVANEMIGGDIYIGGGETDAMHLVVRVAKELQKEYPNIRYHLFSGNADDVTERLNKGLIDFGVLIEPANISKYEFVQLPVKDTWGVLMRKDSPFASKKTISPKDLRELPIISSRQTFVSSEISTWFGTDFEKLNIVATYNLIYNASLMVEEGMGYALALDKLINTSGESMLCFKPLEPRLEAGLDIVWKKNQVFSKASALFMERIKKEFISGNCS